MAQGHDDMLDVELIEEPDAAPGSARTPGPSARRARARPGGETSADPRPDHSPAHSRARLRRRLRVAAVALTTTATVLAALTLSESASTRRDDRSVAAAADTPGLVGSVRRPVQERWRGPAHVAVLSGFQLVPELHRGTTRTVARDTATGEIRWALPLSLTPAHQVPACLPLAHDASTLTCELPGQPGIQAANTDEALGSTPGRLITLDAGSGAVLDVTVLPVGTVGWDVDQSDLVTARMTGGKLLVERLEPVTSTPRWSTTVPLAVGVLARQLTMRASTGFVLLDGVAAVVVDATTGRVLHPSPGAPAEEPSTGGIRLTADHLGFTVWQARTGIWYDRQGRAGARIDGEPWSTPVDDSSGGSVVLVRDGRALVAVDVLNAAPQWTRAPVERVLLRLDGVLLISSRGALRAADASTGQSLWSTPVAPDSSGPIAVSDGVRVLVVAPGEDGQRPRIRAVDLHDGTERWSVPMPDGTSALTSRNGVVVATGDNLTVVLD